MTLSEAIAEIESRFSSFANSNDLDKVSIKTDILNELKKFGLNICDINEAILQVSNSQVRLPEEFKSLKLALLLDPIGCHIHGDRNNITQDYIYYQRIENPAYFNEVTQEYITSCDSKIVTEKITINNTPVDFFYDYQWLSLVKGINKKVLSADCLNIHPAIRNGYLNQINITNNILNTNFSEGRIYLQYYALPNDGEEIIIPEFTTGDLLQHILNVVKIKIAEDLIANNANPQGIAQLYSVWKGQEREYRAAALRETNFHGLDKGWSKRYKRANQRETAKFNLPSLKF